MFLGLVLGLAILFLSCVRGAPIARGALSYAVIIDGGSTGTRVHCFSWKAGSGSLPEVEEVPGGRLKVTPGISSFESHPESAGSSLTPLLELAERVVPASEHSKTLVLLRATAGMRLISKRRAQRIYTSLYDAVVARGRFKPRREDFGTLSGEDEGIFGWLCANYLLKRAGRISTLGTVGALDLGGGSTQITLATTAHASESSQIDPAHLDAAESGNGGRRGGGGGHGGGGGGGGGAAVVPRVTLPHGEVPVFTHSHLGFGNKAVLAALASHEAAACLATGANASWEPSNKSVDYLSYLNRAANEGPYFLIGKGDFDACDNAVRRVLKDFDRNLGQPSLRGGKPHKFIAMSLFFYVEHFINAAGYLPGGAPGIGGTGVIAPSSNGRAAPPIGSVASKLPGGASLGKERDNTITAGQLHAAARKLCAEPDASLRRMVGKDPLTNDDALRWRCFDATYAARLLTDGYGFPEHEAAIEFLGEIDGVEVEWTLGALLSKLLSGGADGATATADGNGNGNSGGANAAARHRASQQRGAARRHLAAAGLSEGGGGPSTSQLVVVMALCAVGIAALALRRRSKANGGGHSGSHSRLPMTDKDWA